MKLSSREVELIRSTFRLLEPKSGVAALAFYQRLFALDPSRRALWRGDIETEAEQWMNLLREAAELADQPRALQARFGGAGARWFRAGGTPPSAPVGEVLLWSLSTTLGKDFTPEARTAWAALVAVMENQSCSADL